MAFSLFQKKALKIAATKHHGTISITPTSPDGYMLHAENEHDSHVFIRIATDEELKQRVEELDILVRDGYLFKVKNNSYKIDRRGLIYIRNDRRTA